MAETLTNAAEFSVSEIAQAVKRAVEDEFGHVRVRGEISGFRGQHASGHAYGGIYDALANHIVQSMGNLDVAVKAAEAAE